MTFLNEKNRLTMHNEEYERTVKDHEESIQDSELKLMTKLEELKKLRSKLAVTQAKRSQQIKN